MGMPFTLYRPAVSLIMLDRRIAIACTSPSDHGRRGLPRAALFGATGLTALAADPLLHAVLEAAPVSTIEFERFLTCARHALLEAASNNQAPGDLDVATLHSLPRSPRQCFVNDTSLDCDDKERSAAAACRTKLLALLDANAVIPPFLLLAVSAYFPLDSLRDARPPFGFESSRSG